MSPSLNSSHAAFEIPESNYPLPQGFESSQGFSFSPGSTGGNEFGFLKSNLSTRSRPRLTKVRRKQVDRSVKTDLTLSGSVDVHGEVNLEGKSTTGNSTNASANTSQTNKINNSFVFTNTGFNTYVQRESGIPPFVAHPDGSNLDQNLQPKGNVFISNNNGLRIPSNFEREHFVFGGDKSDSAWSSNFCARESNGSLSQSKVDGFNKASNSESSFASDVKLNQRPSNKDGVEFSFDQFDKHTSTSFTFSCSKNASAEANSVPEKHEFGNHFDNSESVKDSEEKAPDMWAKVKSNASEDNGSGFQSQCATSVNSIPSNVKFEFGSNEWEFQKASQNGFVSSTGSDVNFKFQSSSSSFDVSNGMKKLNINESKEANRTENSSRNCSVNGDSAFMFGNNLHKSGFMKEDHPINTTEDTTNPLSRDQSQANDNSSSRFAPCGIAVQPNGGFCEAPSMNKCGKEASNYGTPSINFAYSSCNFTPGMNSGDNRSRVNRKNRKKNTNLRERTVVHPLFCEDHTSRGGSFDQSHKSPNYGSPMDVSPCQEGKAVNFPDAAGRTRIQGEFPSEMNMYEHTEGSHDAASNSSIPSSVPSQDGLSSIRCQHKKKYKMKVGGANRRVQRNDSDKENAKQKPIGVTADEVCEHWRIRGNEAYHAGKFSKAEEFYSIGISSFPHASTLGIKPLLLCYSNRAATRMSLGRMTEAIDDCSKAEALDPNFLKATLRAGNCHLVLGEVENAILCYNKCLNSRTNLCLDRRVTIEAAEGLQKAEKVADYMQQSAKLLQEGTQNASSIALQIIEEALEISRYSERLFEMKGEALLNKRLYDNVIQFCEQTLDIAKRNYDVVDQLEDPNCKHSRVKLWRWHLKIKSHYHLGRLDLALELIEKYQKLARSSKSGDLPLESSIPLTATIHELLRLKQSGNEAFNGGRYTEAIENYTAAISKSFESRPFMAVCFCNRAAAYQSVHQILDAIADCSIAIALDENYEKAISRRATLYEMVRDYKQAACDLESLVALLENKSQTKSQQNGSHSRSSGGGIRDLRKARRHLSLIQEKAKKEIPLDHYIILGIKSSDSESEIKKAYRKAALKHHPDKAGQVLARSELGDVGTLWKEVGEKIHEDADKLFKVIGAAYAVLSDPSKRSQYDTEE